MFWEKEPKKKKTHYDDALIGMQKAIFIETHGQGNLAKLYIVPLK